MPSQIKKPVTDVMNEAIHYARSHIIKGYTQLDYNHLNSRKQRQLKAGVTAIRDHIDEPYTTKIDTNAIIERLDQVKTKTSHYSLGNCQELAELALVYIGDTYLGIEAELYTIANGDHVFIVINRDPKSDPEIPATWGKNAYICDPWANIAYPAREFRDKLRDFSYKFDGQRVTNFTKELEPYQFLTTPKGYDTNTWRSRNKPLYINSMKDAYKNQLEKMLVAVKALHQRFQKLLKSTPQRNTVERARHRMIGDRIFRILDFYERICALQSESTANLPGTYDAAKSFLQNRLAKLIEELSILSKFNSAEISALYGVKNANSLKAKAYRFFSVKPQPVKEVEKIYQHFNHDMSLLMH